MPTWETVCELGAELPDGEIGTWYGPPALKVRGKGFARLGDDGALVVMVDVLERGALELRERLIESWCRKAPKRLVAEFEARFT